MKRTGAVKVFHGIDDAATQRALGDLALIADAANENARGYSVVIPIEIGTSAAEIFGVIPQANVARAVAGMPITDVVTLTFKTTAGTVDATAYTVPASPTGNNRFSLHRLRVRLKTAISGTGSVIIRAGTSVGGNDILVDSASWTSATSAGTEIGISIADFGTAFLAATGYVAELAASAVLSVRATTTGTLSAGDVEIFTYGAFAS